MATKSHSNYRDAGNGQFIAKKVAERRNPDNWVKERVKPASGPGKKK